MLCFTSPAMVAKHEKTFHLLQMLLEKQKYELLTAKDAPCDKKLIVYF